MTTYDPSKYKHKPSPKHTLEEVLKSLQDLIRNDLLDAKSAVGNAEPPPNSDAGESQSGQPTLEMEKPALERATPVREEFAPTTPESGPINLDAVMRSLKDLVSNELDTGEESAPAIDAEPETIDAPPPPFDAQQAQPDAGEIAPEEYTPEEFTPLDEELTLDETAEAAPAPPPTSAMPELPGEISEELIIEREPVPAPEPPAKTESVGPEITKAGAQQELPFDAPPLPAVEARLPPREPAPASPLPTSPEPAVDAEAVMPETSGEPPAITLAVEPEAALPTIDVEESFDAGVYFDTTPASAESASPGSVATTIHAEVTPVTPEPARPDEPPPPEEKPPLELAIEPTVESTLTMPSVDFETVDLKPPQESAAPPVAAESPMPENPPPATASETTMTPETTPAPATETPPAPEIKSEPDNEAVQTATLELTASAPGVEASPETAAETPSTPAGSPPPFNLDDIPVLKEVVAPPAGSALQTVPPLPGAEPRRPSPDRARDLVVRAVAKLNIEMRRTGGVGLDTKTILRLQQLIREELEKDGKK
ncbi:MAG TPA: hypothetical protein VEI74_12720 [Candidatus Methylomirabilis sp.]|nr:hypothetical protein [Candidatus Methylomirabilis sp.]